MKINTNILRTKALCIYISEEDLQDLETLKIELNEIQGIANVKIHEGKIMFDYYDTSRHTLVERCVILIYAHDRPCCEIVSYQNYNQSLCWCEEDGVEYDDDDEYEDDDEE